MEREKNREKEKESIDLLAIISSKNDENKQLRIENNDCSGYQSKETQTKTVACKADHRC
jgi:hypothetical protein